LAHASLSTDAGDAAEAAADFRNCPNYRSASAPSAAADPGRRHPIPQYRVTTDLAVSINHRAIEPACPQRLASLTRGVSDMSKKSSAFIALRLRRRAARSIAAIGVVSCLATAGLTAAVHGAGAAVGTRSDIVPVDRTHKGDRLPLATKQTQTFQSPVVTSLSRPPIGCEPAFSRAADPKRSHIFGRCIS
jgi:hypothetical protein